MIPTIEATPHGAMTFLNIYWPALKRGIGTVTAVEQVARYAAVMAAHPFACPADEDVDVALQGWWESIVRRVHG